MTTYKTDASHLLNFKPPVIDFYDKWSPAFNYLEKKIGELPLYFVMKYMDYNEWEDTRYCFGFQCSERIFNYSSKYYCNDCFYNLQLDGFLFCKKCRMLEDDFYHCNFCHKMSCTCLYCSKCNNHEKECNCYFDIDDFY